MPKYWISREEAVLQSQWKEDHPIDAIGDYLHEGGYRDWVVAARRDNEYGFWILTMSAPFEARNGHEAMKEAEKVFAAAAEAAGLDKHPLYIWSQEKM